MAGKKIYAVKKGKVTGVFKTWEECRESVDGFPGAEYRGFSSQEEAYAYLGITEQSEDTEEELQADRAGRTDRAKGKKQYPSDAAERPQEGRLLAYVDGSYEDSLKKYAFGCVFLTPEGHIYTQYGNGDREQSLQHRNVTGEMLGAMYAVKTAMVNGFQGIEIRYDYQGIEKWVTGEWRSKTELTRKYALAMRDWGRSIEIRFQKVAAHTNVRYNELADSLAKKGLREGNGVPKIVPLEEMEEYNEIK
ncbi:MAG: ribonuclease H family protein [Firmicutes bacterium]|nr:ribonuclease H family protein [Bacillota bacterium]